jgi:hypothetical protein
MSLSDKGMLRWYASCCNTPIGNTSRDFKVSHVGLLHNCLQESIKQPGRRFRPGAHAGWHEECQRHAQRPWRPAPPISILAVYGQAGTRKAGRQLQEHAFL